MAQPYPGAPEPTLLGLLANDLEIQKAANAVKDWWRGMNTAQKVGTSPVGFPITDAAGLLGDVQMYIEQPDSRNLLNYAGSAAGLLPFVPSVTSLKSSSRNIDENN